MHTCTCECTHAYAHAQDAAVCLFPILRVPGVLRRGTWLDGFNRDVAVCQAVCAATTGCAVIRFHKTTNHCHLLSGPSPSRSAFEAAIEADDHDAACALLDMELVEEVA